MGQADEVPAAGRSVLIGPAAQRRTREQITARLRDGLVIPALPLALREDGTFDERYQAAVVRYYAAAGAGGVAAAVHTTQFEIRDRGTRLLEPVLELTAEVLAESPGLVRIAGVAGDEDAAVAEAELAARLGYDAVLLSPPRDCAVEESQMLDRARSVAEVLPVIGFYLQEAIGGPRMSGAFWREFAEIENVVAVKVAPFPGGRWIDGGLLGQWAVGTHAAAQLMTTVHRARAGDDGAVRALTARAPQLTELNAAVFDAENGLRGCIAGVNAVLWWQGLLPSMRCLNPRETLSAGQADRIRTALARYPWTSDEHFIADRRSEWLR
ncbi:dihydrodipicolinate synthase family protein [Ruania alba]|uniref:Dihydrodipicolinate synthase/N-acetylneuraminate lyase n=1 Tax=Ruania alba TaxID=648782 RepID=A0A1H5NE12_9MICO|nr:dihydrodipicolinate synthase family protein [Ruania alba]SEE99087.1 Dihydrodipicolinate synthase/N-acetylneuraminate lyase [Ruania alba]